MKLQSVVTLIVLQCIISMKLFSQSSNIKSYSTITIDVPKGKRPLPKSTPKPTYPSCIVPTPFSFWSGENNSLDNKNHNHLTAFNVTYQNGKKGKAFYLNNGYLESDNYITYTYGVTYDLWIKTTTPNGIVFDDGGGCSTCSGMGLFIDQYGNLYLTGSKSLRGVTNFHSPGYSINDGNWHRITCTWDGTNRASGVKLYTDGELIGITAASEKITTGTTHLFFGGSNADVTKAYDRYSGLIDEIRFYNQELTACQIKSLHKESQR